MDIVFIIIGLALVLAGAHILTEGSAAIAEKFRISEFVIGLTIVAVGTSMPEFVVSSAAAVQGSSDMAIGNVVGSNLFNILFILGGCSMITPLTLGDIDVIDISMVVLSAVLPFVFAFTLKGRKLDRIEGAAMVLIYIGYVAWLISKVL